MRIGLLLILITFISSLKSFAKMSISHIGKGGAFYKDEKELRIKSIKLDKVFENSAMIQTESNLGLIVDDMITIKLSSKSYFHYKKNKRDITLNVHSGRARIFSPLKSELKVNTAIGLIDKFHGELEVHCYQEMKTSFCELKLLSGYAEYKNKIVPLKVNVVVNANQKVVSMEDFNSRNYFLDEFFFTEPKGEYLLSEEHQFLTSWNSIKESEILRKPASIQFEVEPEEEEIEKIKLHELYVDSLKIAIEKICIDVAKSYAAKHADILAPGLFTGLINREVFLQGYKKGQEVAAAEVETSVKRALEGQEILRNTYFDAGNARYAAREIAISRVKKAVREIIVKEGKVAAMELLKKNGPTLVLNELFNKTKEQAYGAAIIIGVNTAKKVMEEAKLKRNENLKKYIEYLAKEKSKFYAEKYSREAALAAVEKYGALLAKTAAVEVSKILSHKISLDAGAVAEKKTIDILKERKNRKIASEIISTKRDNIINSISK